MEEVSARHLFLPFAFDNWLRAKAALHHGLWLGRLATLRHRVSESDLRLVAGIPLLRCAFATNLIRDLCRTYLSLCVLWLRLKRLAVLHANLVSYERAQALVL